MLDFGPAHQADVAYKLIYCATLCQVLCWNLAGLGRFGYCAVCFGLVHLLT